MTGFLHDRAWRCECGSGHFLTLRWEENGPLDTGLTVEGYLVVEGDGWTPFRARLGQAWRLLRGGHAGTWVSVILDGEKAAEVIAALQEFVTAAGMTENREGKGGG